MGCPPPYHIQFTPLPQMSTVLPEIRFPLVFGEAEDLENPESIFASHPNSPKVLRGMASSVSE